MNKSQYLKQLKRALFWRFSKNEIEDIISDYEEYFEEGLSQGQTEDEICHNLGVPTEAVNNLTKKKITIAPFASFLRLSLAVFTVLTLLIYVLTLNVSGHALIESIIFTVLIPSALYGVLGGRFKLSSINLKSSKKLNITIVCFSCFSLAVIFYFRSMLFNILNYSIMPFDLLPQDVGPFFAKYLMIYNIIALALFIGFINQQIKQSLSGFHFSYIFIGCIASVANLKNVLYALSDVNQISKATLLCLLPFLVGLFFTLVMHSYSKLIHKEQHYECSN